MAELKPCPFCGSVAALSETESSDWFVFCMKCRAMVSPGMTSKEDAIKDWNTRAPIGQQAQAAPLCLCGRKKVGVLKCPVCDNDE